MQKRTRLLFWSTFILVLSLLLVGVAFAQGGFIAYGQSVTGAISDQSPVALYTFQGNVGELMTVQVAASAPGLDPTLTLLSPAGVALANNDNDPFSFNFGDARLSYALPETGVYSLVVGSTNNTRGNFSLRLFQRASSPTPVLLTGTAQIDLAAGLQTVIVTGNPNATTPITIQSNPPEAPYSVEVREANGRVLAVYLGLPSVTLSLPALGSDFVIVITATVPGAQGLVLVNQGASTAVPVSTEEAAAGNPPANVCSVTPTSGAVNVRSGPSTDFSVLATLQSGQYLEVVGQNSGWYVVTLPGAVQGWVAGSVVTLNGPCTNLPTIQPPAAPPPPAQPPTNASPTPVPTTAPGVQQPTSTPPQQQPTIVPPTATQAAQAAPPDNNYVLVVPLDGSASLSDFVSYPNGDVEDVVSYDTSGLNSNSALPGGRGQLSISLTCVGTGAEFITFRIDGQNYTCGQTFQRTVNADSDTGAVRITATGGEGTYIQWTLSATLPRL